MKKKVLGPRLGKLSDVTIEIIKDIADTHNIDCSNIYSPKFFKEFVKVLKEQSIEYHDFQRPDDDTSPDKFYEDYKEFFTIFKELVDWKDIALHYPLSKEFVNDFSDKLSSYPAEVRNNVNISNDACLLFEKRDEDLRHRYDEMERHAYEEMLEQHKDEDNDDERLDPHNISINTMQCVYNIAHQFEMDCSDIYSAKFFEEFSQLVYDCKYDGDLTPDEFFDKYFGFFNIFKPYVDWTDIARHCPLSKQFIKHFLDFELKYHYQDLVSNKLIPKTAYEEFFPRDPEILPMTKMQKFVERTKKNAIDGAYSATANSLVSGVQASVKTYIQDESLKSLLDSEVGKVAIAGVLSTVLMMAPVEAIQNDPRAQKLADKLQEKSISDGLTKMMELAATMFLPAIMQALSSLPKEEKIRVMAEDVDGAEILSESVEEINEPKKRRAKA